MHDLADVRSEWTELAGRGDNVFLTWEWADAWRRHLAADVELATALVRRRDGTPLAVLPLYVDRARPVRVLRFIGAAPADELGPVCAPEDLPLATELLRRHAAAQLPRGGVLLAERLGGQRGITSKLGGRLVRQAASPVAMLRGESFEEYLATRSRNFRSQFRRAERRLLADHGLRYRLTKTPQELGGDLSTLMLLHARRWSEESTRSFRGARREFHLDFARRAMERGWLRLWTLELDGEPAAAWYGLRFGGSDHYYQAGRDPDLGAEKVGFVLLGHTIREACQDGLEEYRFGRGDEEYKGRFADEDSGLDTVAVPVGGIGRAALDALRAGLRARDEVRRWR